jgi:hypothetical protein
MPWDVTPCRPVEIHHYSLGNELPPSSGSKSKSNNQQEASSSSEMSMYIKRHIPEYGIHRKLLFHAYQTNQSLALLEATMELRHFVKKLFNTRKRTPDNGI